MKSFKQITEQYREKGRFHPVKPHNVGSVAAASPRGESDSANVKLKEDEQIDEIVMSQVKADKKSLNALAFYKKHGVKKSKLAREDVEIDEATSAAARLQKAFQRAKEQREREERAGEALLKPKKADVFHPGPAANEKYVAKQIEKEKMQQEGAVPSTEKVITVKHKTSGKTLRVASHAAEKYKKIGYHPVNEEVVMEREDDEYHTPSKHYVRVQVSKGDGPKTHFKATVRAKEPQHAVSAAIAHYKQKGYTVHDHKYLGEEVEMEEACSCESTCNKTPKGENCPTHGMKDCSIKEATKDQDPPFDPDPPKKKSVVPGKYGSGYSTARHLARQALQKQAEKYKPVKESLEESRKAEIVKEIIKKKKAKSEDAFQSEPELSSTLTKV